MFRMYKSAPKTVQRENLNNYILAEYKLREGIFRSSLLTLQIILYKYLQTSSSSFINRGGTREREEKNTKSLSV